MVLEFHQVLQVDPGTSGKCTCWGLSANGTLPRHLCTLHHGSQWYSMDIQWYEYVYYICLHSTAPVLSVFEALAGTQSAWQWPGFPPNLPASQPTEPKLLLLLDRVGQPVSAGNEEEICKPSGSANVNKILIRFNQIQTHSSWGRLESFILIHIGFVWLCLKIGYPIPSTGSSASRFQMVNPLVMVNR